jgi:hypothetical protein
VAKQQFETPGRRLILQLGSCVAVLRDDEFAFNKFALDRVPQIVARLRETDGDARELGLGRSVVPLAKLKAVSLIPGYGIVAVRWRSGIEPKTVHLRSQDGVLIDDFYQAVRDKYRDSLVEQQSRAAVTDVPADPQLAGVFIFWLLGLLCVISGAFTQGQVGGGRRNAFAILAMLGQWIGPIPSMILGGVLVLGGAALLFRWFRNRPDKTELTPSAR